MKRDHQILIIFSAVLVSGFLTYVLVWNLKGTDLLNEVNDSTSNNRNVHFGVGSIPKLLDNERKNLELKIENWSLYEENSAVHLGTYDCSVTENRKKLDRFNAGSKKVLRLNEGYTLIETPNYYAWDQKQMEAFATDPGVICGVASNYPFVVLSNRVLWRMSCSSGIDVDPSSPSYPQFRGCIQAGEVVNRHFGISE